MKDLKNKQDAKNILQNRNWALFKSGFKIASIFFVISLLWIVFSDRLLLSIFQDSESITRFQTFKGLIFNLALSVLLFFLVRSSNVQWSLLQSTIREESVKYKTLFDGANHGILILNSEDKIIDINQIALDYIRKDCKEVIGEHPLKMLNGFPLHDKKAVEEFERNLRWIKQQDKRRFNWSFKNTISGEEIHFEISSSIICLNKGWHYQLVFQNITARVNAEQALKNNWEQLRLMVKNTPIIFWIKDLEGKLLYHSPNTEQVSGYSSREFLDLGSSGGLKELVHPMDRINFDKAWNSFLGGSGKLDVEHRSLAKDKQWIWFRTSAVIQQDENNDSIVFGFSIDISDKKSFSHKMQLAMTEAEEKERLRLSGDLHDGVSPVISALKLYIETANNITDSEVKLGVQEKIMDCIQELSQSIKTISSNISPHILQNYGLEQAINTSVKRMSSAFNLDIQFKALQLGRFHTSIESTIYRVVNELVNNTHKHANATKVTISLDKINKELYLSYADNGKGLPEGMDKNLGMGLFNIKSRIHNLNGELIIKSKPNKGMQVFIRLPFNEEISSNTNNYNPTDFTYV